MKSFAIVVLVGLAGLGGFAVNSRKDPTPTAVKTAPAGPTVETTVIQRTEYIHRRVHHKKAKASGGGTSGASTSNAAPVAVPQQTAYTAPAPAPAPKPTTSPSSTGGGGGGEREGGDHEGGGNGGQDD
jgi:hypothetical protein